MNWLVTFLTKSRVDRRGMTLMEMMMTVGLLGILIFLGAATFQTGRRLLSHSSSSHDLELEQDAAANLIARFLRHADSSTVIIGSDDAFPWSRLQFSADGHRYLFYADHRQLMFKADDFAPKSLSQHLSRLSFAVSRARLPALLSWSICLANPNSTPGAVPTCFSGSHFLEQSSE